jgi:hypothetical protein
MRSRSAWLTVSSGALAALFAGCGGGKQAAPIPPKLPHALGQRLASEADAVARAASGCAALTRAQTLRNDVNTSLAQIPGRLRAPLRLRAAELASRFSCSQPAPQPTPPPLEHGHGKHKGQDGRKQKNGDNGRGGD